MSKHRTTLQVIACFCLIGSVHAWSAPAMAADKDCAPLGSLPGYVGDVNDEVNGPRRRAYETVGFDVDKPGGGTQTVNVAGRYCHQVYRFQGGAEQMSDLEIQSNYRDELGKLGATILHSDEQNTEGKLVKGGQETWFKVYSQGNLIDVTVVDKQPPKQVLTAPSGQDYRLLGHMPGYAPSNTEKRNFDEFAFDVDNGSGGSRAVTVQGAKYIVKYAPRDGAQLSSDTAIQLNYRTALKQLGAQILYEDEYATDARLEHGGQTIWVKIESQEKYIVVSAIEEKAFQASIQPPQADALKAALDKDGHVALYVNFDFDKATLRPDAAPVLAQVVALLQGNPGLKLAVEGNTDDVGAHDYNVKLSQERAASVVAALVKDGIAADRLKSSGNGPDQPIADNGTSEGRAKNRRVELVKA